MSNLGELMDKHRREMFEPAGTYNTPVMDIKVNGVMQRRPCHLEHDEYHSTRMMPDLREGEELMETISGEIEIVRVR